MGNTVCVGVDPGCWHCHQLNPSLRISSLAGAECSRSSSLSGILSAYLPDITPVSRSDKVANGSIQKQLLAICSIFWDRIWRVGLSGCEVEKTTAAYQSHMTSFQFMPMQITCVGCSFLVEDRRIPHWWGGTNEMHPWSFSANERGAKPGLNSWTIAAKCRQRRV